MIAPVTAPVTTPHAALPGALFSVWHNVTGSALAAHWVRRVKRP